jgi:hypothetical protein
VAESSHREFYRVEHCHILRPLRAIPQIVDHSLKPLLPFGVRLTLAQSADQLSMSTRDGDPGRLAGDVVGNHTIQRFGQRLDHFLVFRRSSRVDRRFIHGALHGDASSEKARTQAAG